MSEAGFQQRLKNTGLSVKDLEICPYCLRQRMFPPLRKNALSRKDNKTLICSDCGEQEAKDGIMRDYSGHN